MAFRGLYILKLVRSVSFKCSTIRASTSTAFTGNNLTINKAKSFKTEDDLTYLEDPDNFGTLARKFIHKDLPDDEDDVKEEERLKNIPLPSQKLTTKQYADLIKQYLANKRLKQAIEVLEVKMITEDRVKPENYIYNILIGACADVGYTKKAFKLFNDMKKRGLKTTGDTYTCLFTACANSPWSADGLKNAKHLRELMIDKGIEPNLTNYNAMIKAFGRCGDLSTAFQLVDEMSEKKIKIRVHTLNNLLHACISDKEHGLKHALIIWRKMLKLREKPNIYSFNLMLRCVKDCNVGTLEDMQELMSVVQDTIMISAPKKKPVVLSNPQKQLSHEDKSIENATILKDEPSSVDQNHNMSVDPTENKTELIVTHNVNMEIIEKPKSTETTAERIIPNLLSKQPNMQEVLSLQSVNTATDKFAIVGGLEDFINEMEIYGIKPDIKTFTQMLMVMDDTREAEIKLLDKMKASNVKADIDFFNMLIKKRCLRSDYEGALDVKNIIAEEDEFRKKRYSMNKKLRLKMNIMTYGVLAMTCKTKEDAVKLLEEMKEKQLKVNITILGTFLRQGTVHGNFKYVMHVMNVVKEENIAPNRMFIKHLEEFNDKCVALIKKKGVDSKSGQKLSHAYKAYIKDYERWLKDMNIEEALKTEHPWAQFRDTPPESVQRSNIVIKPAKKIFKKRRHIKPYSPRT